MAANGGYISVKSLWRGDGDLQQPWLCWQAWRNAVARVRRTRRLRAVRCLALRAFALARLTVCGGLPRFMATARAVPTARYRRWRRRATIMATVKDDARKPRRRYQGDIVAASAAPTSARAASWRQIGGARSTADAAACRCAARAAGNGRDATARGAAAAPITLSTAARAEHLLLRRRIATYWLRRFAAAAVRAIGGSRQNMLPYLRSSAFDDRLDSNI